MVGVEQWAELRREHFVGGKSIKELVASDGVVAQHDPAGAAQRDGRRAIERPPKAGVLEPFKDEIHRLLKDDPKLPGVRVRELLEPLGCTRRQDGRR